ncbi:MAG: beta-lactamase family protein [Bacteroidales bacterium]|nr:beta-lactamase family protein [Bacteroidales bacterium]
MKAFLTTIIFLSLNFNYLCAQINTERIDSVINNHFENGEFNGSALVTENGKAIYKNGFGYSNFEWEIKNSPDTKFAIGSCTKQFTATLIMKLIEENKLSLEDNISKYIPEYPADKGSKITIHNLLSHTSGIPDFFGLPQMRTLMYKENKPDDFIKTFWDLELDFEPGSQLKYSNSGYFILGVIIEKVTGLSYAKALKEYIFNPLQMNNSGVLKDREVLKNKAYGYIKVNEIYRTAPYFNPSGAFSAGAIYSTVEDLLKWQNSINSNSILSQESIDKMLTVNFSRYGYGFAILEKTLENGDIVTLFGHEGQIFGFRSLIQIIKEDNCSVILLDNSQSTELGKIASEIRKVLYKN